ncbi:MAG: hypothetical protein JXB36_02635 [Gammaproteobacteria bacterium]|nr:hypothetical protein [Gammaproteobacteria bacterium]
MKKSHAGGRPPKFNEPSGPVTVTLPKRTLDQLRRIDEDRAKAIVKLVDAFVESGTRDGPKVEIIEMAPGTGIVLIPPNRSLRSLPWVRMIEVAPTRYLLAIVPDAPVEKIEVALLDLIDDARGTAPEDVPVLELLVEKLRELRRGKKISLAQILFVSV